MDGWMFRAYVAISITVLISVVFAITEEQSAAIETNPGGRDRNYFSKILKEKKPDVVLLGNSMVKYGVDDKKLEVLLGSSTAKLARGGTASAAWFLTLKNVILKEERIPKVVVIFFRDTFLTDPNYRIRGRYRHYIESLLDDDELAFNKIIHGVSLKKQVLSSGSSVYRRREQTKSTIDLFLKDSVVAGLLEKEDGEVDKAIGRVFDEKNLDEGILTKQQVKAETVSVESGDQFKSKLEMSFLPYMIDCANSVGTNLVFVRIKRRRDLEPGKESVELKDYIENLRIFMESEGVEFFDFTYEKAITIDHFGAGDHLNSTTGRALFTELLAEKLKPILESP